MNNKEFSESFKKRIYKWLLNVLKMTEGLKNDDYLASVIKKQLIRCSTSVVANYVEAIAGCSAKDFINFLNHSLKSANESKFWLALTRDTNKTGEKIINPLISENIEIAKILGSIVSKMRNK
ncbi:MAG: hypothetical protein A3J63_02375 [Candidatus Moranbacteria bacterium RIFCSPHIGHO2_02_FULL_40_12b]|nr:MAG: hypothetical protein A3J63_02375 [Candidatus Moranbacteria bacterium RIFCSPHIGHO2_02_FULL_40_12b]